jgi:hypothetical protein
MAAIVRPRTPIAPAFRDGGAVDAVAIAGVPVDVAFYAPDAFGAEFIMIRDGRSLTDEQLDHLTGG